MDKILSHCNPAHNQKNGMKQHVRTNPPSREGTPPHPLLTPLQLQKKQDTSRCKVLHWHPMDKLRHLLFRARASRIRTAKSNLRLRALNHSTHTHHEPLQQVFQLCNFDAPSCPFSGAHRPSLQSEGYESQISLESSFTSSQQPHRLPLAAATPAATKNIP